MNQNFIERLAKNFYTTLYKRKLDEILANPLALKKIKPNIKNSSMVKMLKKPFLSLR